MSHDALQGLKDLLQSLKGRPAVLQLPLSSGVSDKEFAAAVKASQDVWGCPKGTRTCSDGKPKHTTTSEGSEVVVIESGCCALGDLQLMSRAVYLWKGKTWAKQGMVHKPVHPK